jgi:hypothetical protein
MTDAITAFDARSALAGLRPQPFGSGNPNKIVDPLIEPMWAGIRALAAIGDEVAIVDEGGATIDDQPAVSEALGEARLAEALIVDGILTKMAIRDGGGVFVAMDDLPTAGQMMSRPLIGIRRTRAEDVTRALDAEREARTFRSDDTVTFVATDLLWLDGESILDVPLQERRRLLESTLGESDLVRRGVFVRPPADPWMSSWRSVGFTRIAYKSANSRYRPGMPSPEWINLPMPRR